MAGERGEGIARRCKCELERVFLAQPLSMLVAKNFSPTRFLTEISFSRILIGKN